MSAARPTVLDTALAAVCCLVSLPALAAVAPGSSGNGELFLNVFDSAAKVSYAYDTGIRMDDFFIEGQPDGGTQFFRVINDAIFGQFLTLVDSSALAWSVVAIDSTGPNGPGFQRLFTTARQGDEANVFNLTNGNLSLGIGTTQGGNFFNTLNGTALTASGRASHSPVNQTDYAINGSSYSLVTDNGTAYYGKSGGLTPNLNNNAPFGAANKIGQSSWFYYLTRSGSTSTNKVLVDEFDNGDGINAASGHDAYWGFTLVSGDTTSPYFGQYLLSYTLEPRVWSVGTISTAQRAFTASIGRTETTSGVWVERLAGAAATATLERSAGWVVPLGAASAVSAVPEPGQWALLLAGGLALAWRTRTGGRSDGRTGPRVRR